MVGPGLPEYAFLSYSRRDQAFAAKLAQDLRARGIRLWFDQLDIPPGANWDVEIHRALHGARAVLFIVSESSVASDNVLNELSVALETGKSIIPVMIANVTVPLRITRLQRVDFVTDYHAGLAKLAAFMTGGASRTWELAAIAGAPPGLAPAWTASPSLEPVVPEVPRRANRSSWVLPAILGAVFGSIALLVGGAFLLAMLSGNDPSPRPSASSLAAANPKPHDQPATEENPLPKLQGEWSGPCRQSDKGFERLSISFDGSDYFFERSFYNAADCIDTKVMAQILGQAIAIKPRGGGSYEADFYVLGTNCMSVAPAAALNREGFLGIRQWRDNGSLELTATKQTELFGSPLRQGAMIYDLLVLRGNTLRLGGLGAGGGLALASTQRPASVDQSQDFFRR